MSCGTLDLVRSAWPSGSSVRDVSFVLVVSKATRLTSRRCSGEMLSEVMLPPQDPQPKVSEGASVDHHM